MTGITSISTSCMLNPFCNARRKYKCTVCHHCYAVSYQNYRPKLREAIEENHRVLNERLLKKSEAARIVFTTRLGRIESFGDVASVTCARNYLRIIRANPMTRFGIWTKNPNVWKQAIELEGGKKPRNSSFVYSSLNVDEPVKKEDVAERYPFFDHVFTVYSKKHLEEAGKNNININCGARSCLECGKCYKPSKSIDYINEILK